MQKVTERVDRLETTYWSSDEDYLGVALKKSVDYVIIIKLRGIIYIMQSGWNRDNNRPL